MQRRICVPEICTSNPQYTLPVASLWCISPRNCRDMYRHPSVYAFSGIIRAHISFGFPNGFPMCDGPRTRYFRIKKYGPRTTTFYNNLSFNKIQIGLVRGPFTEGRLRARGINPSAATESRTHTFPGYPCHSERSEESGVKIWSRGTVVVLQILHSACGCVYGDRKRLRLW